MIAFSAKLGIDEKPHLEKPSLYYRDHLRRLLPPGTTRARVREFMASVGAERLTDDFSPFRNNGDVFRVRFTSLTPVERICDLYIYVGYDSSEQLTTLATDNS